MFFKCFSQEANFHKYWKYRSNLVTRFLVKGEAKTMCPSTKTENPVNIYDSENSGRKYIFDTEGYCLPAVHRFDTSGKEVILSWGDAPMNLGYYIGVLATEYKILSDNGEPTDSVLQELYYAMKAYERIDNEAEKIDWFLNRNFKDDVACSYNGYFLRDDITPSFIRKHLGSNHVIESNYYTNNDINEHPTQIEGKSWHRTGSQDHRIYLMMGLGLVVKCVPKGTSLNEFDFHEKAKEYVDKFVEYVKDGNYLGTKIPYDKSQFDNKVQKTSTSTLKDVLKGTPYESLNVPSITIEYDDFYEHKENIIFSYGLANAAGYLRKSYTNDLINFYDDKYENYITGITNTIWQELPFSFINPLGKRTFGAAETNVAIIDALGAMSNSWSCGFTSNQIVNECVDLGFARECFNLWCLQWNCKLDEVIVNEIFRHAGKYLRDYIAATSYLRNITNYLGISISCAIPIILDIEIAIPTTGYYTYLIGREYNMQIFNLLHNYIYDKNNWQFDVNSVYKPMLNSALLNGNFHYKDDPNSGAVGWRHANRWEKPSASDDGIYEYDIKDGATGVEKGGQFNGLDYMLLYNLLRLKHPSNMPNPEMYNRLDCNFKGRTPASGKQTFYCFNSANLDGINLSSDHDITIKYGKIIDIPDDFDSNGAAIDIVNDIELQENDNAFVSSVSKSVKNNNSNSESSPTNYYDDGSTTNNNQNKPATKMRKWFTDDSTMFRDYILSELDKYFTSLNTDSIVNLHRPYTQLDEYISKNSPYFENNQNNGLNGVKIYPNPAEGKIYTEFYSATEQIIKITIDDISGKTLVSTSSFTNSEFNIVEISIENLKAGSYVLNISSNDHNKHIKFIKK